MYEQHIHICTLIPPLLLSPVTFPPAVWDGLSGFNRVFFLFFFQGSISNQLTEEAINTTSRSLFFAFSGQFSGTK